MQKIVIQCTYIHSCAISWKLTRAHNWFMAHRLHMMNNSVCRWKQLSRHGLRFTLNSWAVFAVNKLIVHAWCFTTINHTVWLAESLPLQSAIVYWVQKLPHVLQFLGVAIHTLNKQKWICGCDHTWKYNFHEIFGAHLKFTVSGQFKQASIYTCMENAVRGSPGSPL